jgi:hypothetical protein
MKKTVSIIAILSLLAQTTPLFAWTGGPYSGNTADGFQGGVWQYTMSMRNGMGMARFSAGLEPIISAQAQSVIIHQGLTYYGECFGMVDTVSKKVSGITNSHTSPPNSTTGLGTPNTFRNGQQDYICNTSFTGKLTSTKPVPRFRGKGFAYFFNERYENRSTTSIDQVEAVIDIPGPEGTAPGSRTEASSQTIDTTDAPEPLKVKMKVTGGRISPIPYTNLSAVAAPGDARF